MYSWQHRRHNPFQFLPSIGIQVLGSCGSSKGTNHYADVTFVSQKMAARGFAARL